MKKSLKRAVVSLIAGTSLAANTTVISAIAATSSEKENNSRSVSSNWEIHRISGAPSSTDRFEAEGNVTGLVDGTDDGVTFNRSYFYDNGNGNIRAKCDIQNNVKAYPFDYAFIDYYTTTSTCLFKSGWFSICSGTVHYTVDTVNYAGYAFTIRGYAN